MPYQTWPVKSAPSERRMPPMLRFLSLSPGKIGREPKDAGVLKSTSGLGLVLGEVGAETVLVAKVATVARKARECIIVVLSLGRWACCFCSIDEIWMSA